MNIWGVVKDAKGMCPGVDSPPFIEFNIVRQKAHDIIYPFDIFFPPLCGKARHAMHCGGGGKEALVSLNFEHVETFCKCTNI
jgi:hypothetical protein